MVFYYEDEFRQLGQYEDVETGLYYNRFRYYNPETGLYISQDPIKLAGNNPNFYAYVHDSNAWVDPFGLDLVDGTPLLDNTKLFRIGGSGVDNLKLKSGEIKLDPPGISVIRANSAEEAAKIMRDAFPDAKKFSKLHEILNSGKIGEIDAKSIRDAGFDVIHNPTKGIGDAHARLIHPDGADGFSNNNLKKLSDNFKCPK
nr:RHS repeat-associated core domain-containing protein [Gilliamella sp. Lep-s35]